MSSLRRWRGATVLLAVLMVAAIEAPADAAVAAKGWPMKQDNAGYTLIETPHYVIKTDMGADAAQMFARHQEALFLELYKRMAGTRAGIVQLPRSTALVVGSKDKYMELMGPEGKGTQGLHEPQKNQISAWGSIDGMDRILEVLRHEGTHQFVLQFIGPKCPLWLNEGLAEFFERAEFVGGQFQVGQVPAYLVRELNIALEENRLFSVPYMLTIEHEAWSEAVKKEGKEGSLQYAEAWAMVHCLQGADNAKYQGAFIQYIWHLGRGRSSKDAWDLAFGGGVAAFEKRFRDYIKELQPTGGRTCRNNLWLLGLLLVAIEGVGKPAPADITAFRQLLLDGKLGWWTLPDNKGAELSTKDPDLVKSLFRCPDDTSRKPDAPSYELFPGKTGEPPGIRCPCHAGYVLETVYEKNDAGKLKPKIVSRPVGTTPPAKAGPAAKSSTSKGAKKQ